MAPEQFTIRALPSNEVRHMGQALLSAEAARYIGMSDSWLRQSRMAGRVDGPPFIRAGDRSIRYRLADLDQWLADRRCTGGGRQPQPTPAVPSPTPPRRKRKPLPRKGGRRAPAR